MAENVLNMQMDEHLMNVQHVTKAALDRFEESGLKVDQKFRNHFLKMSIDRMTQTCKRHETEAKWRTPPKTVNDTAITLKPNAYVKAIIWDMPNSPVHTMKRCSGDIFNAEQVKKSKSTEINSYAGGNVPANIQSQLRYTIFYCVHCMDPEDLSKSFNGTIDVVYSHWLAKHGNESVLKPFQFYAVALVNCFHCNIVGTYTDLVEHHQEVHLNERFAIVDRIDHTKCGVCHSQDDDLLEHFDKIHSDLAAFNPIQYTEERIIELLIINIYKDPQCLRCMHIFKTQIELMEHYAVLHGGPMAVNDSASQILPLYFICGHCQKKVDRNRYMEHFKVHVYHFRCSKCSYRSVDLVELILHENNAHGLDTLNYHCKQFSGWLKNQYLNTNVVFDNGLILQNYNVAGTKYDNNFLFDMFIVEFLDLTNERVLQRIETNGNQQKISPEAKVIDSSLMIELNEQRKHSKNIYINGTPHNLNDNNLHEIFQKLCEKLEINLLPGDVKEIYQCKNGLIVKLNRIELKDTIFSHMQNKNIWSGDLIELSKDQKSWKIQVRNQMTKFYCDIWIGATKYKEQGALHSFRLSDGGVVVRRTSTDGEHIILSKQQLIDFVEGK